MPRFAATMNAARDGLDQASPQQGIKLVEDWIGQLQDIDVPGVKGVLRDLETLKRELGREEPRDENLRRVLARLGDATVKAAERVEGGNGDKLRDLGEALRAEAKGHAGGDAEEDEEEADRARA